MFNPMHPDSAFHAPPPPFHGPPPDFYLDAMHKNQYHDFHPPPPPPGPASSHHFSSWTQHQPPSNAVTSWTSSWTSSLDRLSHRASTWSYDAYAPSHDYPQSQPVSCNYTEAPYDFAEYPKQSAPHHYTHQYPSHGFSQTYPYTPSTSSTDYTSSPVDGLESSSYFAPTTDPDPPRGQIASCAQSTYSSLKHALDEPSPVISAFPVASSLVSSAPASESTHPADDEEPPMGFLRPDSPALSLSSGIIEMPKTEPLRSPGISQALPAVSSPAVTPTSPAKRVSNAARNDARKRTVRISILDASATSSSSSLSVSSPSKPVTSTDGLQEVPACAHRSEKSKAKRGRSDADEGTACDDEPAKRRKKPALACLFCRERKIACGLPEEGAEDKRCNQCVKRARKCEMPAESRRGHYQRRKAKEKLLEKMKAIADPGLDDHVSRSGPEEAA